MAGRIAAENRYPEVGVCGLSCLLCPRHHTEGTSRCAGCKSDFRMAVGCPFITCAVRKKGVEFCWDCKGNEACDRWGKHREFSRQHDTFVCYQKLEDNISSIMKDGVVEFEKVQKTREQILREMIRDFNEGRSKNYYCIAATVMETEELKEALREAKDHSRGQEIKEKSKTLHSLLDRVAERKNYSLKLRRQASA